MKKHGRPELKPIHGCFLVSAGLHVLFLLIAGFHGDSDLNAIEYVEITVSGEWLHDPHISLSKTNCPVLSSGPDLKADPEEKTEAVPDETYIPLKSLEYVNPSPQSMQPGGEQPEARVLGDEGTENPGTPGFTPVKIFHVNPEYPAEARRKNWEGAVFLNLEITPAGDVGSVVLVKSSGHALLDRAAQNAAKSWKYLPAPDQRVVVHLLVKIIFRLED